LQLAGKTAEISEEIVFPAINKVKPDIEFGLFVESILEMYPQVGF
jgi:hypothetical protein